MQPAGLERPDRQARGRVGASTISARPPHPDTDRRRPRDHPQAQIVLDEGDCWREEQTAGLLDRWRAGSLVAAIPSLPLDGDDLHWDTLLGEPILEAVPRC